MCYSAMVQQSIKSLGLRFQARIQLDLFEEVFRRRLSDRRVRIPKGLEHQFLEPSSEAEQRIFDAVQAYRKQESERLRAERARQLERLATAERALALRASKKAETERRIAEKKIGWCQQKLDELVREQLEPADHRVFPQSYAPVVVVLGGEPRIVPMRYQLRPSAKPASFDQRFPGLYNARRDNLAGFWRPQFGRQHGLVVVTSFFENVARHDYERRPLPPGDEAENVVVEFTPTAAEAVGAPELSVACLWDRWESADEPALWSFAAITDEPPADVRDAGHDRCVVALKPSNVHRWLTPAGASDGTLLDLLADRDPLRFEHRLA